MSREIGVEVKLGGQAEMREVASEVAACGVVLKWNNTRCSILHTNSVFPALFSLFTI